MRRTLLDTDILSFYLKGERAVVQRATGYLAAFGKLDLSVVTYYEIRRGLLHARALRKLADFEKLVQASNLWQLDHASAQEASDICSDLWQRGEPLDDADVLIAGTARAHLLALATNNISHFGRIAGLELDNWLQ